jgi:hypothetical protein
LTAVVFCHELAGPSNISRVMTDDEFVHVLDKLVDPLPNTYEAEFCHGTSTVTFVWFWASTMICVAFQVELHVDMTGAVMHSMSIGSEVRVRLSSYHGSWPRMLTVGWVSFFETKPHMAHCEPFQ